MKKKGFTLIELLAVIVILAVIALIATPAVLNIIEDSKKAAAEASARNIASTAKTYYMQKIMEGESISDIDLSGDTLTYDGDKATKGNLTYDDNSNITGKMYISGYCIEIKSDGTTTSTKMDESKCSTTIEVVKEEITITTSGDLTTLLSTINTKDTKNMVIKLTNDIDLSGIEITPIGTESKPFLGVFDGLSHTIANASISTSNNYAGIFGYIGTGSTIKNLTIENTTVTGKNYVGGLAGYSKGNIINVIVENTTINGTDYVGGIVGYGGKVNDSTASNNIVNGTNYVGGLAGDNVIANSCSLANNTIKGTTNFGSVIGKTGTLTDVMVDGEIVS